MKLLYQRYPLGQSRFIGVDSDEVAALGGTKKSERRRNK